VSILRVGGVESGGTTSDEKPQIVGLAAPFATIDVFDGTALLGVVTSNGQGHWSLQLSTPLFAGIHDLSAVQATGYGQNSTTAYFAITVEASENARVFENEDALSGDSIRRAHTETQNGSPFFPQNLFTSHGVPTTLDHAVAVKDTSTVPGADTSSSNDTQSFARQTSSHAAGANSFDMVAFLGDHQVLDLSAVTDKSLAATTPGIGGFDLGGHHNALVISLSDVLTLGEQDLFIDDGKHQLIVNGKEGDSVDLQNSHVPGLSDGEWHHHGTAEVGGVLYNVIEHSSANTELLVEHPVRIEVH
jgi:hypothetical protein